MKLYLDEHVSSALASILRERGIDGIATRESGNIGQPDQDQLVYATTHGRALVTFNRNDFLRLAQQWAKTERSHAGLILSKQAQVSELLRLLLLWSRGIATMI